MKIFYKPRKNMEYCLQDHDKKKIHDPYFYSDEFEEFYREYPRSDNKPITHHEWIQATKEHEPDDILRAAKNYKRAKADTDATYIHKSYNFLKNGEYRNHLQQNETKKTIPDFDEENWL